MTHAELVELGIGWLAKSYSNAAAYGHYGCGVIISELSTTNLEIPDVLGFSHNKSILIECKTSIADFNADKNKPFREYPEMGIGAQRWYMAPLGVIPKDKLPAKWGLLEVAEGRSILVTKEAETQKRNFNSEITILLSLVRRLKIVPDGKHIAIKQYKKIAGLPESKNRAAFYIEQKEEE